VLIPLVTENYDVEEILNAGFDRMSSYVCF
jgi:hypothetical protein